MPLPLSILTDRGRCSRREKLPPGAHRPTGTRNSPTREQTKINNMNDKDIPRAFRSRIGALPRAAQRLLGALNDTTIGPPVAATLPVTFVADFTTQIDLVEKHGTDQSGAFGTLHNLTRSQAEARAELFRLASLARRSATLAFSGQDPLLRSEFQVGIHDPRDLSSVLERARLLLAACEKYPDELATNGWPASNTTALSAAVDALASADQSQKTAADTKVGITAQRTTSANTLYKQCLLAQNAARMAYTGAPVDSDPAALEARARYLLGEFPRRVSATVTSTPTVAEAPAPAAPVSPLLAA